MGMASITQYFNREGVKTGIAIGKEMPRDYWARYGRWSDDSERFWYVTAYGYNWMNARSCLRNFTNRLKEMIEVDNNQKD